MNIQILTVFSIYSLVLIFIGYLFSKKANNSAEYILGDRSTNFLVTAIALQASDMSHWLFLGFPAIVFIGGFTRIWEIIGLVFFMFLNWQFIAPKIRRETEKTNSLTLFSYLEKRFADKSGKIRIISALISTIFLTFYIASGLVALGLLFENSFGLPYHIGILIGLLTTIIYTLVGGYTAVAWCDFFQGIFAVSMILFVPTYAYYAIGGWSSIAQAATTKGISFNIFSGSISLWSILSMLLMWGPGYIGQPQIVSFFMGIKDPKKIKYAKYIGLTWQTIALLSSAFIGLVGIAYFQTGGQTLYIQLTKTLFSPVVSGIILCAIHAATQSTLDSYILTAGTLLSQDFYKKIKKRNVSQKKIIYVSRLSSALISLAALLIAFNGSNTIYNLVKYAWTGTGCAFSPLVAMSLYSKKINRHGALAGIITGAVAAGIFPYFNSDIPALIPGFICSFIAIFLVSYLTKSRKVKKLKRKLVKKSKSPKKLETIADETQG